MPKPAERFIVQWNPAEPDSYRQALAAIAEKIQPLIEQWGIRYCIIPSRTFDPIARQYKYRLDAVEVASDTISGEKEW